MKIGITGNMGSGKSSVANILREKHGAYIIDADEIAHKVILKGQPAYNELLENFEGALGADSEIDRKALGGIVFRDNSKRELLMEITHRHIVAEMLQELENTKNHYPHVVLDAPLLIEANLHKAVDVVWLVYAEESLRIARIIARDRMTEQEVLARVRMQTPFEELKKRLQGYSHRIIENKSDLKLLETEIENGLHA